MTLPYTNFQVTAYQLTGDTNGGSEAPSLTNPKVLKVLWQPASANRKQKHESGQEEDGKIYMGVEPWDTIAVGNVVKKDDLFYSVKNVDKITPNFGEPILHKNVELEIDNNYSTASVV